MSWAEFFDAHFHALYLLGWCTMIVFASVTLRVFGPPKGPTP
jgi:hypothetical protein